jgi:mercuric ion transport protein
MASPDKLLRIGIIGTLITALCCFTPVLVFLFGIAGLAAVTGYLDLVLFPALAAFIALSVYALRQQATRRRDEPHSLR